MGHILWLEPIFKEKIWGGNALRDVYNYPIPSDKTGECWAIAAHQNGDCLIKEGKYQGVPLSRLFHEHNELFGNIEGDVFPLLVKIIDAHDDLSIQVHPNDTYAKKYENSLGKTECWYVLEASEEACLIMGHNATTKDEFIKAIEQDDYDNLLRSVPIKKGDFFYIPAGTVHAICRGCLLYEAQQSSDVTYRLYDYHRKDDSGKERELHTRQSIDVTTIPYMPSTLETVTPEKIEDGMKTSLLSSPFFNVVKYDVKGTMDFKNTESFQMISIVEGSGYVGERKVIKGDHGIICADQKETKLEGNMRILMCSL